MKCAIYSFYNLQPWQNSSRTPEVQAPGSKFRGYVCYSSIPMLERRKPLEKSTQKSSRIKTEKKPEYSESIPRRKHSSLECYEGRCPSQNIQKTPRYAKAAALSDGRTTYGCLDLLRNHGGCNVHLLGTIEWAVYRLVNSRSYGTSRCLMDNSTINMAMFNSCVKLREGNMNGGWDFILIWFCFKKIWELPH